MEVIRELDITSNIIVTDEDATLFFDKPFVLEQLPSIDTSLINDKYLTIETHETILDMINRL